MHLKLISCEIFFRETCAAVRPSPHVGDNESLPKGLRDIGSVKRLDRLQADDGIVTAEEYSREQP